MGCAITGVPEVSASATTVLGPRLGSFDFTPAPPAEIEAVGHLFALIVARHGSLLLTGFGDGVATVAGVDGEVVLED
ncbi:hypothetical protein GCM10022403_079600 [Streptomyces coacervatus]|uniref:Uncharacterized protein n=1 Tax=Streptomyces coacervatus TaxID=647381 RepID=A0ABP7J561_9ACTN